MITGWYYLHENGELLYKRDLEGTVADIRESDFAIMLWPMDLSDRAGAWRILVEALACDTKQERIFELAEKWKCDDADAEIYAKHVNANLFLDGNAWCATRSDFISLQESPAGFGDTALEALAGLCKELGFEPSKMWGKTFDGLLKVAA